MANSADPDQLASSEANWSGSTLFVKQGISGFSRTRVKGKGPLNTMCVLNYSALENKHLNANFSKIDREIKKSL